MLGDAGNARVIVFTLVIGALIATVEASGGVRGFVDWVERRGLVTGGRGARVLAFLVGIVIFIESNITVLVSGAVARPLFDRHRHSREMLAYLIDSTSAAVCVLIPLNAWGAYVLALLAEQGVEEPLRLFITAIPQNLYALAAVALAGFVAVTGWAFGPMRRAEARADEGLLFDEGATPMLDEDALVPPPTMKIPPRPLNMLLPLGVMVATMPLGLWITGGGDLLAGSGSTSVLWAVLAGPRDGVGADARAGRAERRRADEDRAARRRAGCSGWRSCCCSRSRSAAWRGSSGTGLYVAQLVAGLLPPVALLPLVFLTGAFIAFSTGTSWGTFAIMIPIAVPAAAALGLPAAPFLAAALSGGIFGDHASPISDTTIVSSLAAATDHIAHVRTQLPYALLAAGVAVIGFAAIGAAL